MFICDNYHEKQIDQNLRLFKAGFPKVGSTTPLGVILVRQGVITGKGVRGG